MIGFSATRVLTPGWGRTFAQPKHAFALPLSIALHLALIYALSRLPWGVSPQSVRPTSTVIWLDEWRPSAPAERPAPESEAPAALDAVRTLAPAAAVEPRSPPRETAESDEEREMPPPAAQSGDMQNGSPATKLDQAVGSSTPSIDWQAAEQRAVAAVLEEQARERGYRTFSLDDVVKATPPAAVPDPVTQKMFDGCHVVKSKLEGMAWGLLGAASGGLLNALPGFCLRGPHADLFADIKPDYLKKRPFCAEAPGAEAEPLLADARHDIRNVKCRLVSEEEYAVLAEQSGGSAEIPEKE
jgi:hypothetical protein